MRSVLRLGPYPLNFHGSASMFLCKVPSVGTVLPTLFCPYLFKDQLRFSASIPSEFWRNTCIVLVTSFSILHFHCSNREMWEMQEILFSCQFLLNVFGWRCLRLWYMILCMQGAVPRAATSASPELLRTIQSLVLPQTFHVRSWRNIALYCTVTHCRKCYLN